MRRILNVQIEHGPDLTCTCAFELAIHEGDLCVVKTDRVLEFGKVIHIKEVESAPPEMERLPVVLRRATLQDQSKAAENAVVSKIAQDACIKQLTALKMEIHLIHVRYSFDRAVLAITLMAEERTDFRDLIRTLEADLNTRVEIKQIGVRDTAKLIGGIGSCGQQLCCHRWEKTFEAISVKMAKMQRLSLGPNTISGMCGRLKCCLRYEYDCYKNCARQLPRDGRLVESPAGRGIVVDQNILAQRLKIRMEDNRILEFGESEISPVGGE